MKFLYKILVTISVLATQDARAMDQFNLLLRYHEIWYAQRFACEQRILGMIAYQNRVSIFMEDVQKRKNNGTRLTALTFTEHEEIDAILCDKHDDPDYIDREMFRVSEFYIDINVIRRNYINDAVKYNIEECIRREQKLLRQIDLHYTHNVKHGKMFTIFEDDETKNI